jgi:hypothetical protein
MVVFGPNQVWSRFDVRLNFKFKPDPHVSLLSCCHTRTAVALCFRRLLPLHTAAACRCATCTPHSSTQAPLWPHVAGRCSAPSLPPAAAASCHGPLPCACLWSAQVRYGLSRYPPPSHAIARPQLLSPVEPKSHDFSDAIAAELNLPPPHCYAAPEQPPRASMEAR